MPVLAKQFSSMEHDAFRVPYRALRRRFLAVSFTTPGTAAATGAGQGSEIVADNRIGRVRRADDVGRAQRAGGRGT